MSISVVARSRRTRYLQRSWCRVGCMQLCLPLVRRVRSSWLGPLSQGWHWLAVWRVERLADGPGEISSERGPTGKSGLCLPGHWLAVGMEQRAASASKTVRGFRRHMPMRYPSSKGCRRRFQTRHCLKESLRTHVGCIAICQSPVVATPAIFTTLAIPYLWQETVKFVLTILTVRMSEMAPEIRTGR